MGESDREAVINAAKLAGVHDMIMRLPDGYATEIGEEGVYLSGGQRQRIALARAVYGEPKLLVLDEPEANLDWKGKKALAHILKELQNKGSMIVLISHHKSVLDFSDYVLTLRKGKIEAPSIHQAPHTIHFNNSAPVASSQVKNLESLQEVNQ
jgi:ABC-type protease/lipase transport system fused ATPase/permease subunit